MDIYEIVERHIQKLVNKLRETGENNKIISNLSSGEVVTPESILQEIKNRTKEGKEFVEHFVDISIELTLERLDKN